MEKNLSRRVFTQHSELPFPDADYKNRIKLSSLFRIFSDIAGDDYIDRGLDYDFLQQNDYVFLMSRLALKIHSYPKSKQKLTVSTWECMQKGAMFIRANEMTDEDGNVLVEGEAGWICVSIKEHKIYRPSDFRWLCEQVTDRPTNIHIGRIPHCDGELSGEYTPKFTDIDMNGHVYNGIYGDIIQNSLSKEEFERGFSEVRINYLNEMTLGEKVSVFKNTDGDNVIIRGKDKDTVCFEFQGTFL